MARVVLLLEGKHPGILFGSTLFRNTGFLQKMQERQTIQYS